MAIRLPSSILFRGWRFSSRILAVTATSFLVACGEASAPHSPRSPETMSFALSSTLPAQVRNLDRRNSLELTVGDGGKIEIPASISARRVPLPADEESRYRLGDPGSGAEVRASRDQWGLPRQARLFLNGVEVGSVTYRWSRRGSRAELRSMTAFSAKGDSLVVASEALPSMIASIRPFAIGALGSLRSACEWALLPRPAFAAMDPENQCKEQENSYVAAWAADQASHLAASVACTAAALFPSPATLLTAVVTMAAEFAAHANAVASYANMQSCRQAHPGVYRDFPPPRIVEH